MNCDVWPSTLTDEKNFSGQLITTCDPSLSKLFGYWLFSRSKKIFTFFGLLGERHKKGVSIVIATSRDKRKLKDIEKKSDISFINGKLPNGSEICKSKLFTLIERIQNVKVNERQIQPFLQEILKKLESLDREQLIKHFISTESNQRYSIAFSVASLEFC